MSSDNESMTVEERADYWRERAMAAEAQAERWESEAVCAHISEERATEAEAKLAEVEKERARWQRIGDQANARGALMADELDRFKTATQPALDEIAKLCGCPEWEYPGQVIRDVQAVVNRADAAEAKLAEVTARLRHADELLCCVPDVTARAIESEAKLAKVMEWARTYGKHLTPSGADTYGEGMRDSKAAIAKIVGEP